MVYPGDGSGLLKEENWPAAARPILADFLFTEEGKSRGSATPRFILARGNKVIMAVTGNAGWKDTAWPKIQELTKSA